jgi:hypothetical protein
LYKYYSDTKITHQPISNQNNFYKNLDLAIKTAMLTVTSFQVRDFNNEIEFYVVINDNPIKVLVSTLKNPFWQVATLQQVVKTAKIDQGKLKLVDLSSKHPYVTFKNN